MRGKKFCANGTCPARHCNIPKCWPGSCNPNMQVQRLPTLRFGAQGSKRASPAWCLNTDKNHFFANKDGIQFVHKCSESKNAIHCNQTRNGFPRTRTSSPGTGSVRQRSSVQAHIPTKIWTSNTIELYLYMMALQRSPFGHEDMSNIPKYLVNKAFLRGNRSYVLLQEATLCERDLSSEPTGAACCVLG